MAFDQLQALGDDKFKKITNALMRGKPAMVLAREIQSEWGDFVGVAEKTLTQQLNRLRLQMQEGAYGEEAKEFLKENARVDIKLLRGSSMNVLADMIALVNVQRDRIQYLWDKERELKMPLTGLNNVINDTRDLLVQVQKVQFDLGVDEFKGVVTGFRGQIDRQTLPDGTHQERYVYEAVSTVEEIFRKRGVHLPPPQLTE